MYISSAKHSPTYYAAWKRAQAKADLGKSLFQSAAQWNRNLPSTSRDNYELCIKISTTRILANEFYLIHWIVLKNISQSRRLLRFLNELLKPSEPRKSNVSRNKSAQDHWLRFWPKFQDNDIRLTLKFGRTVSLIDNPTMY